MVPAATLTTSKRWVIALLVSSVFFVLYVFFPTHAHLSYGQDSLEFAYWVETGVVTSINRHFLWNILFFYSFELYQLVGGEATALWWGQFISNIFGAAGVGCCYLLLSSLDLKKISSAISLLFAIFLGVAYSYYHFSVEATPQVFANFLRLLFLLVLLNYREKLTPARLVGFGIGLGVVFHSEMMGIYFLIPCCFILYRFMRRSHVPLIHLGSFLCFVILSYLSLYICGALLFLDIPLWEMVGSILWRGENYTNLLTDSPVGLLYLLQTILHIDGLRNPSIGVQESIDLSYLLYPQFLLFFCFLIYLLSHAKKLISSANREMRDLFVFSVLWWLILVLVQILREPRALDNWSYSLIPFILCLFLLWSCSEEGNRNFLVKRVVLVLVIGSVGLHNFITGIYPNSRFDGYEVSAQQHYLQTQLADVEKEDTLLFISDFGNYDIYALYFIAKANHQSKQVILLDGSYHHAFNPRSEPAVLQENLNQIREGIGRVHVVVFPVEIQSGTMGVQVFDHLYDRFEFKERAVDPFWNHEERLIKAFEMINILETEFSIERSSYHDEMSLLYLKLSRNVLP
ncbi:MAG: hypothetical protein D6B25_16350 [Desulfobulbaceae bacterium]|nr:MAG: hypothetical protein D6B25_16350 [Desulfobulbaceae bacterium]